MWDEYYSKDLLFAKGIELEQNSLHRLELCSLCDLKLCTVFLLHLPAAATANKHPGLYIMKYST